MSTANSSIKPVLPPGTIIDGSIVTSLFSPVTFPNARSKKPFAPVVQAYYDSGKKNLQVSAVIFIDAAAVIPTPLSNNIKVYYDNSQLLPTFNISYNNLEKEAKTFSVYQVNFNLSLENKPASIITFVWDEDPVTSRGTETTVQP
ncbi:hypothetical protein [Flavobacterium sp.]|uniref:hypothetical protein n=1 Tax=Flavobacterium sp. TaxID=239 RepID=UPI00374FFFEA